MKTVASPRHRAIWTGLAAGCIVALAASTVAGQQSRQSSTPKAASHSHTTSKTKGPSTLDGVYTAEQAKRGKDVYFGSCRSCHMGIVSHTGETFAQWWKGKQLSDLYTFVLTRMPKNDPGGMDPGDVADVVAYLLQINQMPVGPNELYPDADSLKQYRIELKSSGGSTSKRKKP